MPRKRALCAVVAAAILGIALEGYNTTLELLLSCGMRRQERHSNMTAQTVTAVTDGCWVHFGCGLCAPHEWVNFDSSPTLRMQRLPGIGRLAPAGPYGRFPTNVLYGDIIKGLPLPQRSASLLYCSHVLEHLCLSDLRRALLDCRRVLRPGGVFRLVVPDLEHLIRCYIADSSPQAATKFMDDTMLGRKFRSRGLLGLMREWLGSSQHLWMWDYKSLAAELEAAGFSTIRRAALGDSRIAAFALVESEGRWTNALGIECR